VAIEIRWIFRASQIDECGHEVDEMARLLFQFARTFNARRPMCNERCGDAVFMYEVLVFTERCEARPKGKKAKRLRFELMRSPSCPRIFSSNYCANWHGKQEDIQLAAYCVS
jgi:hypothetical protein